MSTSAALLIGLVLLFVAGPVVAAIGAVVAWIVLRVIGSPR
jgi:hypothetical protein